jgi:hypothetical protein
MGQEALFNRCLYDVTRLSHDECRTLGDNACGAQERVEFSGSLSGFQGLTFQPLQLYSYGNFLLYATEWEIMHSNIIPFSRGDIDVKPVVGLQSIPELFIKTPFVQTQCYPIVGHVVTTNVRYVYVPSKFGLGGSQATGTEGERLKSILNNGTEAFVSAVHPKTQSLSPIGEYSSGRVVTFKLYVDLNGKILALLSGGIGEAGLESEDPISYLLMVPGMIQLGKLGAKMIWSTVARREVAQALSSAAAGLRQKLLGRGASAEIAEFAALTEEELGKVRGGMAEMKKPRMTAADLNEFIPQERPGMGPKQRLTTPERNAARQIIGVLERVRNGDSWAWAELIAGRGPEGMKMLRFGDLAKQGWAEIDLLTNNPGALNKMRMLARVVRGDIEYKLMQIH